jgi:hypothetical protein
MGTYRTICAVGLALAFGCGGGVVTSGAADGSSDAPLHDASAQDDVLAADALLEADSALDGMAAGDGTILDSSGGSGSSSGGGITDSGGDVVGVLVDGSCGPETCPDGCCQQIGDQYQFYCIPQPSNALCGNGGYACTACEPPFTCTNGSCVYPQPGCNQSNCHPGCCIDQSICSNGQSQTACGLTGTMCADCSSGQVCQPDLQGDGGSCGAPTPPTCGPGTCAGCCLGVLQGLVCAVGNQDIACGVGGGGCHQCLSGSCNAQTGICDGP